MLWIRIRINPHHFGNLDPHPDPHQIKIRNEHVLALFQGIEPLFGSYDLDPHQGDKSSPDPQH